MRVYRLACTLLSTVFVLFVTPAFTQTISFASSNLGGENLTNPTSLQFGPDGRLYVSQQNGLIRAYTVTRNGASNYQVTATETISLVQQIANHNDNGALNTSVTTRQITGILVTGTAANPVIYVTSSDPRIGGNTGGTDTNLDTNSGVISRLTKSGGSWTKVDLVRGLPRSEENHSSNGMALDAANNILYMAQGGHTNMGAPSNNFALTPEYAYSGAILRIDLTAIGNTTYNLPTLDDENRSNVGGAQTGYVDPDDPFGGNDGKNQAMLVSGGPVQIYSPGWRNNYDVLITQAGKMYSFDNGPNSGWGAAPINCSNAQSEPGIANCDVLHYVTQGYFAGHANPTRGSRNNKFNSSNPQTPIPLGMDNSIECTYQAPESRPGALTEICTSSNGIAEYSASNFGNAMKGNLLSTGFNGNLYRFKLNSAGTALVSGGQTTLASGFGTTPLDVIAQGDNAVFPGTIWICTYGSHNITILEPVDFSGCTGDMNSFTIDLDGDKYSNGDETANGTNPCSAASKPADFDVDFVSDITDTDDDNDGISDSADKFARDAQNGTNRTIPFTLLFDNNNNGGILGWGFSGLMNNGSNYMSLYDPDKMTVGGAALKFTVEEVTTGDPYQSNNTQQYGFQLGVNAGAGPSSFIVHTRVSAPFAGVEVSGQRSMGLFIGTGDQDNYLKIVIAANGGAGGIEVLKEVSGAATSNMYSAAVLNKSYVDLYLYVNKTANTVQPKYSLQGGVQTSLGLPIAIPASWTSGVLAAGFLSTAISSSGTFPATWDFIEVINGTPPAGIPQVNITAPANGSSFTAPANISVSATASSTNGNITKVDFLLNNSIVHTDITSPYTHTLSNVAAGSYTLTAVATDVTNATGTSSPVSFNVAAPPAGIPQVNITAPANGSSFTAPANIGVSATASSTNGNISKVDFLLNNSIVHTDITSPYTHTLSNVGAGSYTLIAVATDVTNATGTSSPVSFNVTSPSGSKTALFVVGSTNLNTGDQAVLGRLQALGFTVTIKSASSSASSDANGKNIILISSTCSASSVGTKFTNSNVAVVIWKPELFAKMKMTGNGSSNSGTSTSQNQINLISNSHPLAAGLPLGNATVYSSNNTMSWGKPSSSAIKVAAMLSNSTRWALFGYESGAAMTGMNAPARRVGIFLHSSGAASFTTAGRQLLDAAITWASSASGSAKTDLVQVEAANDDKNETLLVYPNPNSGEFNIELSVPEKQDLQLRIFNHLGQLFISEQHLQFEGEFKRHISLNTYSSGMYYISLKCGNEVLTEKIVVW